MRYTPVIPTASLSSLSPRRRSQSMSLASRLMTIPVCLYRFSGQVWGAWWIGASFGWREQQRGALCEGERRRRLPSVGRSGGDTEPFFSSALPDRRSAGPSCSRALWGFILLGGKCLRLMISCWYTAVKRSCLPDRVFFFLFSCRHATCSHSLFYRFSSAWQPGRFLSKRFLNGFLSAFKCLFRALVRERRFKTLIYQKLTSSGHSLL